jgi:hypothetical protein
MIAEITDILKKHLTDEDTINKIAKDISLIKLKKLTWEYFYLVQYKADYTSPWTIYSEIRTNSLKVMTDPDKFKKDMDFVKSKYTRTRFVWGKFKKY